MHFWQLNLLPGAKKQIQLSKKEYDDLRNNSIHVKGIFMSNNQVQYSQISSVGSNIKMKKKKLNLDENDIDADDFA